MMTDLNTKQEAFAKALVEAYNTNTPLNETDWQGVVKDDDTAYAVQDKVMDLKGQPTAGYKISLTSKETQDMFNADSPLYGQQVAARLLSSPANVELTMLNEPLLEVELAFRAKEDLKATDTLEGLFHKVTVAGDLELPDARFINWFPTLSKHNVMADCAVGGLVVYGQEQDADKVFANVGDAANVHAVLYHDGEKLKEGSSVAVLGNPFNSLHWLVQKLADQGKTLKKGQVVSTGTFVLPPKLTAGKWEAKFNNNFGNVIVNVK